MNGKRSLNPEVKLEAHSAKPSQEAMPNQSAKVSVNNNKAYGSSAHWYQGQWNYKDSSKENAERLGMP